MKSSKIESERRGLALLLPPPAVLDHQVDHLNQVLADLSHSNALDAGVRPLDQHREQVCRPGGVLETSRLAKPYDPLMRAELVLLNYAARRMLWIRKLRQRVTQGRPAVLHLSQLGSGAPAPVLQQPRPISDVVGRQVLP